MLPGMYNPMVRRRRIRIVDSIADVGGGGGGTIFTFSGVNFGVAYTGRVLIACTALRAAGAAALDQISCTIGGVSATGGDDGEFVAGGPSCGAGIWAASVPAGTSGDVIVDWTGQEIGQCGLVLLSVPGISATPFDQAAPGGGGGGGTSRTTDVDIPEGGLLVVSASHSNSNDTTLTGVTERTELAMLSTQLAVGFDDRLPVETAHSVTASWTTTAARGLRLASFSPG
jgi:hypothetical protein